MPSFSNIVFDSCTLKMNTPQSFETPGTTHPYKQPEVPEHFILLLVTLSPRDKIKRGNQIDKKTYIRFMTGREICS
jgi:hypothetical protein